MGAPAVYAAEEQWSALLDRGGVVDFFGSRMDIPVQRRFADVASVQRYVDAVLALESVQERYPEAGPLNVRERKGQTLAHFEAEPPTLAIPLATRWAGRESVVLHEVAHHLTFAAGVELDRSGRRWHGTAFREAMLFLVGLVLGEPAALLLRAGYDSAGVSA